MQDFIKASAALSDITRLRILNILLVRECCVCEVMQALEISQTRASRNLSILYDAGFLSQRKAGLWTHYAVDREKLAEKGNKYLDFLVQAVFRLPSPMTKPPNPISRDWKKQRSSIRPAPD